MPRTEQGRERETGRRDRGEGRGGEGGGRGRSDNLTKLKASVVSERQEKEADVGGDRGPGLRRVFNSLLVLPSLFLPGLPLCL